MAQQGPVEAVTTDANGNVTKRVPLKAALWDGTEVPALMNIPDALPLLDQNGRQMVDQSGNYLWHTDAAGNIVYDSEEFYYCPECNDDYDGMNLRTGGGKLKEIGSGANMGKLYLCQNEACGAKWRGGDDLIRGFALIMA